MDLSSPISSVIPSAHGAVLAVLARTHEPLSGRRVAALTDGRVGQRRVNDVLGELADAGIVRCERHPPAKLYVLNREHVAAEGIIALANQCEALLGRIRDELVGWQVPPVSACLFGSAARGSAQLDSDLDILLVTDLHDARRESEWQHQVDRLTEQVQAWSGNACEVLELSRDDLAAAAARDDRLVRELRADAITLGGRDIRLLLAT
ncbi:MAG TPA: nucleotidyltransferase domain-containing protein [Phycicoccus sp.]|nr:nucleotidyltransferase domain-containing protein [Phycicoccus sp.]